jgi:hypothetical protein
MVERRHHDPIIPIHFLKVPAIARADAVVLCFGACLFPLIVYLPLYLQLGRGIGIGASGVLLLPITLAQVTSAAITGRLVTRTGHVTIFPRSAFRWCASCSPRSPSRSIARPRR